jgi:hypothetical protein
MNHTTDTKLAEYIYASAATHDFSNEDLIDLLKLARKNNSRRNITGMLLHHEGSFIQILEGPEDTVQALFETISRDKRHAKMLLLSRRNVEERTFGDWGMGFACSSCVGNKDLAGFSDLLLSQATALEMEQRADRAHQVLLKFREGLYRQHVDHDASLGPPP